MMLVTLGDDLAEKKVRQAPAGRMNMLFQNP